MHGPGSLPWVRSDDLVLESRFPPATVEGLRRRGHAVRVEGPYLGLMGHAHALHFPPGDAPQGAADPRAEGDVVVVP